MDVRISPGLAVAMPRCSTTKRFRGSRSLCPETCTLLGRGVSRDLAVAQRRKHAEPKYRKKGYPGHPAWVLSRCHKSSSGGHIFLPPPSSVNPQVWRSLLKAC
jgi:hypothetical protein